MHLNHSSQKKFYKISLASLSIITLISGFYYNTYNAQGVDFTFTQTNWNGGQTTNTATHTDNQSNWTQYSAKDANFTLANSGADLQLTNNAEQTTHIDYNTDSDYI